MMERVAVREEPGGLLRFGRFLKRRHELILFVLGLLALAFAYGIAVGKGRVFPHLQINRALDAARDWQENWRARLAIRSEYLLPTRHTTGGVTRHDPAAAYPGNTLLTLFQDGRFGAVLIDMQGRPLHRWHVAFSELFPHQTHITVPTRDDEVSIHGYALLPGGDLIVNLSGYGAARIDRCSRPIWTVPREAHHAVDHLPNGETLILDQHRRTEANPRHRQLRVGPNGFYIEDTLLRVRADGSVAEEISILDLIYESGWPSMLFAGPGSDGAIRSEDPIHHNDVEVLRPAMAAAFPMFKAGDMLLSLRNLNTIMVVDGESRRITWVMTGPFLLQHDPDFLPNGHIMVFDNRATGGSPVFGYSEILEIDPLTREIVWRYQGSDAEPFYTRERGEQQLLPNGNVLVTEAVGGRVFEIAREAGGNRIVWEYVNLAEPGFVGMITGAQRVDPATLTFLGTGCG